MGNDTLNYSAGGRRGRGAAEGLVLASMTGGVVGAIVGFLVWLGATRVVVPRGEGFTGYVEGLVMLLVLPVFLAIGVGVGVGIGMAVSKGRRGESAEPTGRVLVGDSEVTFEDDAGTRRLVAWEALEEVTICTSDRRSSIHGLSWVLIGGGVILTIPDGANGTDELLERLRRLPDFDDEAVVRATRSDRSECFVCWQRSEGQ